MKNMNKNTVEKENKKTVEVSGTFYIKINDECRTMHLQAYENSEYIKNNQELPQEFIDWFNSL